MTGTPPLLMNEWQRVPAVWDVVQRAVDRGSKPSTAKMSRTIDDGGVRHLHRQREKTGGDLLEAVAINTCPEAYRRKDGIAVGSALVGRGVDPVKSRISRVTVLPPAPRRDA